MKKSQNIKVIIAISIALVVGVALGSFFSSSGKPETATNGAHDHSSEVQDEVWTCSMHPQIRQSEPGDCPICGMDLILLDSDEGEDLDPMAISMSPTAMQLADIRTATVGTIDPVKSVRLNGKVQEDERLVFSQSSHIPGRIEKLMVNFTGEYVNKGQTIAFVYSPDLVTAQEELFEAYKIKDTQPQLFISAKEKLKNWKLTDSQVEQILEAGTPKEQFAIQADVSGYVTKKRVNLGDYIQKGAGLYEIADLSTVWVLFDVYESDMSWVKKGDQVNFTVASLPGETFEGTISFIDPVIDPKTRVAKARVMASNIDLRLKPEMFTSGTVEATLPKKSNNVVIPKTAVMWTGKRSVVYVKNTTERGVSFMMRNVTLGPGLGDSFIIENGLETGEEIAVNGTFSIDAAAQLAGKPSMMNPEGGPAMTGHNHGESKVESENKSKEKADPETVAALDKIVDAYLQFKNHLVNDDFDKAKIAAEKLDKQLANTSMKSFKGASHDLWMVEQKAMQAALKKMTDMDSARNNLEPVSEGLLKLLKSTNYSGRTIYVDYCPMAKDNQGALWLSTDEDIKNPYFGSSMLGCGEIHETIE